MPSIRPLKIRRICRWVRSNVGPPVVGVGVGVGVGDLAYQPRFRQPSDLAADGGQIELDRAVQFGQADRTILGQADQQPIPGPVHGVAVFENVLGNLEPEDGAPPG
jgi:hypothetical protein